MSKNQSETHNGRKMFLAIRTDVLERFEALTGSKIVEGYGLTETSPVTHANPLNGRRKIGSELVCGTDPRGEPYYWIGNQKVSVTYAKGSDLAAIDDGKVSVTPLCLDLTHRPMMRRLKSLFPGAKSGPK